MEGARIKKTRSTLERPKSKMVQKVEMFPSLCSKEHARIVLLHQPISSAEEYHCTMNNAQPTNALTLTAHRNLTRKKNPKYTPLLRRMGIASAPNARLLDRNSPFFSPSSDATGCKRYNIKKLTEPTGKEALLSIELSNARGKKREL